jgi:CBS domain-containing protein
MWIDQRGSDVLHRNECLRLLALAAGGVGRLGLVDAADHAVIEPLNYRMLADDVLVQVGPGSLLGATRGQTIVSFEVDQLVAAEGRAWSVLVQGLATLLDSNSDVVSARPVGGGPLVPEPGVSFVRIRTDVLSGRRFSLRAATEPPSAKATAAERAPGVGGDELGQLTLRRPVGLSSDATIRALAGAMEDEDVSAVMVGEHPGSLVTERDLTGALAAGVDPDTPAARVADKTPIRATASTTVSEGAITMADHSIRHLLVVAATGEPIGMVSMLDVIQHLLVNDLRPADDAS